MELSSTSMETTFLGAQAIHGEASEHVGPRVWAPGKMEKIHIFWAKKLPKMQEQLAWDRLWQSCCPFNHSGHWNVCPLLLHVVRAESLQGERIWGSSHGPRQICKSCTEHTPEALTAMQPCTSSPWLMQHCRLLSTVVKREFATLCHGALRAEMRAVGWVA